jgi:hypothetical protein
LYIVVGKNKREECYNPVYLLEKEGHSRCRRWLARR